MKQCSICKMNKELDDFSWKNKQRAIRSTRCKECQRIYAKLHYVRNKKKYSERNQKNGQWPARSLLEKRVCDGCHIELTQEKFDGSSKKCKECKDRQHQEYTRNRWRAVKQKIAEIKESYACVDCDVHYPYYVMDFDHLGNKEFNISKCSNRSWEMILKEIEKCELVCSNCHRARTHFRGLD